MSGWRLGLTLSLLAHAGVVAGALSLGARPLVGPIDVELTELRIKEVRDLPLGGPQNGDGPKNYAGARSRKRTAAVARTTTLGARRSDEKTKSGSAPTKDEVPAPGTTPTHDLGAYGPEGSHLTALMRLDRLRGTDYQAAIDQLLLHFPNRRDLLQGTGLDLFADFDTLLVATPEPRDPSVTLLAARHHLDRAAIRAALTRGAESTDRTVVWREEGERLVGERRARQDAGEAPDGGSDDRIVVLSDPGLAVVAPPAYRALLLGPAAASLGASPDRGASSTGAVGRAAGQVPGAGQWATLLERIGDEEGIMPRDGVVMLKAVDLFQSVGPSESGGPVLFGLEVPPSVSGTICIDHASLVDILAEFKTEVSARDWEAEWPALRRRLRAHPSASLLAFSTLVDRAALARDGNVVRVHLALTHDETVWLLGLAVQLLASQGS